MTKRSLPLLLMLALLSSLLCTAALEADDGEADTSWYSETANSFILDSAAQLAGLAELVNAGNIFSGVTVTLDSDIDLSGIDWMPIGGDAEKVYLKFENEEEFAEAIQEFTLLYDDLGRSYNGSTKDAAYDSEQNYYYVKPRLFSGTFDGGGHTISGLNVTSSMGYLGLFGNVDGKLKNFTVSGTVTYTGDNGDYIAGVVGMLSAPGEISGVTSDVTVAASHGYNVGGVAGFVGTPLSGESATSTAITMCVNTGTVTGWNKVGGIVGENAGTIELCVNTGAISGLNNSTKNGVGGIVGRNGNIRTAIEIGTVVNCYNTGAINSTVSPAPRWSGGIVGFNPAQSSVINCYSTTSAKISTGYTNPIIGYDESDLGSGVVENNYTLKGVSYSGSVEREVGILLESDELCKAAGKLGGAYRSSPDGGYPELLWMLDSSTVTFDVAPATQYAVQVTDRLGVTVAPEPDGRYLLVDGQTYDYTVTAAGYRTVSEGLTVMGDETVSVPLEAVIGPVVTVNNTTGTKTPAAVTGVVSGADYESGSRMFHVDCDRACVVAYTTDGGETYTRLPAAANADGGYDFTIDLTSDTEIAVVLKGDVNLTGTVDSTDALMILRTTVGLNTLTPLKVLTADVNGDGSENSTDALSILRSTVGSTVFSW